jgi:hypothetical protein
MRQLSDSVMLTTAADLRPALASPLGHSYAASLVIGCVGCWLAWCTLSGGIH